MATPGARSRGHGVGSRKAAAHAELQAEKAALQAIAAAGAPTPAVTVPKTSPAEA